jgi:hypothetical protein
VVQGNPVFDYGITANRQPFAMGLLQAVLAVAGALALWRQRHRGGLDPQAPFGLILAGLSTFMITPLSRPLWDLVPLLPLVQFPWRFLSMQALATSLLVCPLAQALNDGATVDAQRRGRAISVLLGAALVSSSLLGLRPERLHISEADVSIERFLLYEYFTANVGTTIRTDYLPALVEPRPFTSEVLLNGGVKPAPLALEGTLRSAELRRQEPTSESWTIEVSSPTSVLAFHTYYYPGWQATVDGHPATIEPLAQLGYIGLRLPEGIHEISLNLGRTRAQRTGEIISVATLTLLVAGLAAANRHRLRTRHYAAILVGLGLLAAPLLLGRRGPGDDFLGPPSLLGLDREAREGLDLTMDFDRAPYLHHNPSGLSFGGQATLTSYEMSTDTVHAGEGLSLTLHWNGVGTGELSALVQLVSPTKHLLGVPLTLSEHSQAITGHETVHRVETPDNLPRGIYFLTVQAANPSGAVQPVNPLGETLGTTYLTPVRVDSHVRAPDAIPALASFGERIDLLSAETEQTDAADLQVLLLWRARSNPVQNYKIALRMRDRSGTTVAALDTQPGYGFYPTSMWRPGELVHDQYLLPIEAGTPPGTDYSLQVTLYDAMTITPIGTAETAGVVVTQPTVGELPPPVHRFGSDLSLTRASLGRSEIEQGDDLAVNLQWGAIGPIGLDYACQIVLLDESGQVKVRTEEQIVKGFPASHWPQGAMVNDQRMVPLAPDLPEGVYTVRLTVTQSELALQVGSFDFPQLLHVLATDRQYQIPPMQTAVGADFGGQVRLLGYDLEKAGQHVQLKLHWQALAQMPHPYKVFVHLFAPQTEEILAQQDIVAGGESYPTTRWAPYEVVTDTVVLDLNQVPSGTYALAVGLYNRDARLAVEAPGGFTVSSNRLLLEQELPVP